MSGKKFLVRVTEYIDHAYEIEAEDKDSALEIYYSYNDSQLAELDKGGRDSSYDTPWDVEEL